MKNIPIYVTIFLLLLSCNKQKSDLSVVETFIKTLKEDKTETIETIDLSSENISELLTHRNDKQNISNFKRNPLSSFYLDEVILGMYILWTIESIRMKEIDGPGYYLYASLNPRRINVSSGELVDQDIILSEVAKAYFEWWNSNLLLEEKLQINPLDSLDLSWN
ncbi:MAG: hypothetical protein ACI9P5_003925 [Saprospiraceae bacterium]|jgi:hypothetical protein